MGQGVMKGQESEQFSLGIEVLADDFVPLLSPLPIQLPSAIGYEIELFFNLANIVHPTLIFPETSPHPTFEPNQISSKDPHKEPASAHTTDFSKISQRFENAKQAGAGFSVPCTSC